MRHSHPYAAAAAAAWLVVKIIMMVTLVRHHDHVIGVSADSSIVTCTQEGIRRAASDTASSVLSFISLPQSLLQLAANDLVYRITHPSSLTEAPSSDYSPTPFNYLDRNASLHPSYDSLMADIHDGGHDGYGYVRVDGAPHRLTEAYHPSWCDTYLWNITCAIDHINDDIVNDYPTATGCVIPAPAANLTLLCPLYYPDCPSPSVTRVSPQSYAEWSSNSSNGYCPPYCLDPLRFDNSLTKYYFDFAYPFDSLSAMISDSLEGSAISIYWNDITGGFRYYPMIDGTYASSVGDDEQWHQILYTSDVLNPSKSPYWTEPYYDVVTNFAMISVLLPVYVGQEWQGSVCADIILSDTLVLLAAQRPTANSYILAIAPNGGVVAADPSTYSYVFCPDPLQPLCINDTFQVLEFSKPDSVVDSISISESRLGFADILHLVNTPNISNLQTVTLRHQSHFVSWSTVDDASLPYIIIVVTPTTDITHAAVWSISSSKETITSDTPSISFTLSNTGLLPVTYHATGIPDGFAVSALYTTLGANDTIVVTLTATDDTVFSSITNSFIWLLQFTPSGTDTYDGCFESLSMQITVEPATISTDEIAFTLTSSLAVLAFVVTIIGAWIGVTLTEQMQSRIRDNKNYMVWFIVCPLAMTMCAIWPCVLIMMSAISPSGTTAHDDIRFDSVWMMTGWLLSLVCLYPSFYLIAYDLKVISPLHALTRLDAPPTTSSSKRGNNGGRICGVRIKTALFSWRAIAAAVLFELAVISPQLMAVHGIIIPGHGVVTHSWRALLAMLLTMVLYPIAITMIVNVYASRWRLAIPLLLAAAIAIPIIVDIASLTLPWVPPATEMVASAGALWKTSHLTLSGCLLAAITFVFFMGGNIMNLKLSRDSLDVAMAETSRELAELKIAFASLQADNIRLWQIVDTINGVRPLPRASATFATISGSNQATLATITNGMTTKDALMTVLPPRGSSPDRDIPSPVAAAAAVQAATTHGSNGVPSAIRLSTNMSSSPKGITSAHHPRVPATAAATAAMYATTSSTSISTVTTIGAATTTTSTTTVAPSPVAMMATSSSPPPQPMIMMATINEPETSQIGHSHHSTNNNMVATLVPPIGTSLKQLASHPVTLELLKDALQSERSIENMMFWLDAGRFELITSPDERRKQALAIYITFIGSDAPHQVNLSAAMAAHISRAVTAGVAPRDLFVSARNEIGNLITTNVLPRFIRSDAHELAVQLLSGLPLPSRISNNNGAPNTPTVTTVAAATAGGHPQSPSSQ